MWLSQLVMGTAHMTVCMCMLCAVLGDCYTLGYNQFGQLGLADSGDGVGSSGGGCHRVTQLEGHVVTDVACGDSFTVAVTKRMCLAVCLSVSLSLDLS